MFQHGGGGPFLHSLRSAKARRKADLEFNPLAGDWYLSLGALESSCFPWFRMLGFVLESGSWFVSPPRDFR